MATVSLQVIVCLLYYRVSTEDQARKGYSLPEQRELCRQRARDLVAKIPGAELQLVEFEDTLGGDLLQRPVLGQVRDYVRQQKPHYFICLDPDRFSRNLSQALLVTEEIEKVGAQLVFVQHDYQKTPEGIMFFQMRGAIAQYEKAKILERTARGARGKLKQGKMAHWVAIYGYRYNKTTDSLDIYEPEMQWVREIFRWAAAMEMPSAIRDNLNDMGIPSRLGGRWYSSTIRAMLRNRTYIGEMWSNRYDYTGLTAQMQLPKERRERPITAKVRPQSEWILVPVPAIVERSIFDAVQTTFRSYKRQSQKGAGLLSGMCRCGLCGGAIHYVPHNRPDNYNLRCINRYPTGRDVEVRPEKCALPHIRANIIEQKVWAEIKQDLLAPEHAGRRVKTKRVLQQSQRSAERMKQILTAQQEQLTARRREQTITLSQVAKGIVDEQVAETALLSLKTQIDNLQIAMRQTEAGIAQLVEAAGAAGFYRNTLVEIRKAAGGDVAYFAEMLNRLPIADKRKFLQLLIREVIIFPGRQYELRVRETGQP